MITSTDLLFDKMDVDTKLAQEYMNKNNYEFHGIGYENNDEYMFDAVNNKIYCSIDPDDILPAFKYGKIRPDYLKSLMLLSDSIQKNIDLFCQLEFLIRNRPIQATKLELEMVIKYLNCQDLLCSGEKQTQKLLIKNDSPIIDIGCVASLLQLSPAVDVVATENTSVVCHLFVQLCHLAGFKTVKLLFIKSGQVKHSEYTDITKNKVLEGGCIGVVTTQSDVESAVNVFLTAPNVGVWGIRRVLVQESASEKLKAEFAWKTRSEHQTDLDSGLKSQCTDLYVYEEKLFLREYVGNTDLPNVVLIESFRTVKELLSLIKSYSPFCVSLWSDGVAESNEIAFGITAPMVWVNRYAVLGDPHHVCLAYFSQIVMNPPVSIPEMDAVLKMQKDWVKLTDKERCQKALNVWNYYLSAVVDQEKLYNIERHQQNFVHIGANDLVIGVETHRDVYAISAPTDKRHFEEFIKYLIGGSGFLISGSFIDPNINSFVEDLARNGFPIRLTDSTFVPDSFLLAKTTRIVHSSFGTIFAN